MTPVCLLAAIAITQGGKPAAPAPAAFAVTPLKTVLGVKPIALEGGPFGTRFAASLENNTIRIYDVIDLKVVQVLIGHPQPAYAIAWHPNGQLIASGDESARIFIWDIKTGKIIRQLRTHIRGIQALSFDSTGTKLLSTGKDDFVKVYDLKTGKEERSIPGKGANFYSATFMSGGSFGVGTLGDGVRIYGPAGFAKKYLGHEDRAVWDFDYSPASNRLISAGRDATAIIWDMKLTQKIQTLRGHGDWVNHVRLTPNGKYAFTASTDRTVKIWDMKAMRSVQTLENMASVGSPLAITADGTYLIGVNLDDWMQVYTIMPAQGVVKPSPKKRKRR